MGDNRLTDRLDALTEDYSRTPVPDDKKVGGVRIAAIITGIVITVPVLIVGAEIAIGRGLAGAIQAFFGGGLILAFLGCLTAYVGARANLSTYVILQFPFGQRGGKLVNMVVAISVLGWFAVTAAVFGDAVQNMVHTTTGVDIGTTACTVAGSLLMIATTIFGFKALDRLAIVAVPLLILLMGSMVVYALGLRSPAELLASPPGGMTAGTALSVVIGGYIVGIVLMPDLTRYARSGGHGVLAAILSMIIALPLVLLAAAIACVATGEKNLVSLMIGLGVGVPALVLLTFATWTSNAVNLYSSSLVLAAIVPTVAKWKFVIVAGAIGTLAAAFSFASHFVPFLVAIGVALPPVAGIYVADFFLVRRQAYDLNALDKARGFDLIAITSWIVGACTGAATANGLLTLSTIPGCDSIAVSFVIYLLGKQVAGQIGVRPPDHGNTP